MNYLARTLLATLLALPLFAHAVPSQSSLTKLAELMPYESLYLQTFLAPYIQYGETLAYDVAQDTRLDDNKKQQVMAIYDAHITGLVKQLEKQLPKEELKNAYITAAKNYSQEEVDALIAFYGSEAGQSALRKQMSIADAYLTSLEPKTVPVIKSYEQTNTSTSDKIKQIIGQ